MHISSISLPGRLHHKHLLNSAYRQVFENKTLWRTFESERTVDAIHNDDLRDFFYVVTRLALFGQCSRGDYYDGVVLNFWKVTVCKAEEI